MKVQYCQRCVYPSSSAVRLEIDAHGVCTGCRVAEDRPVIDWESRWQMFKDLTKEYSSQSNYDLIIPVSGGKDSYFQTHLAVKELGLKPLLVTYHGNNYLPEGEYNLHRMRDVFDCDHIIFRPSVDSLIKMNRLGFRVQGDMNWHAHCGIATVPFQVAVRYKVPLVMWGEIGWIDLGGMFTLHDFPEFTFKNRVEHDLRGFDWHDFTDEGLEKMGRPEWKEGLAAKDLMWGQYPSDDEVDAVGLRGIYMDCYVPWDGNHNAEIARKHYGWKGSDQEFERTYRRFSNLDDMHENGIHDYLKFIKFGYGRCSDHATKDIRTGRITRDQGIELVARYDHVKPRKDLERWLDYVGMTEREFDETCDSFRDPRVWWIEDGQWWKDNIWGQPSSYGRVHLPRERWAAYNRKSA